MKNKFGFFLFLLALAFPMNAVEYSDGDLRLVINESKGRFSLYSLGSGKPEPLFSDTDPRTSFLSVMVDDRSYKMGDTFTFKTRLDTWGPSLIYEAPFMIVTQKFSFVKNPSGSTGLRIDITLENRGNRSVSAGARYLFDTSLSEKSAGARFSTSRKTVSSETLITRYDNDSFWKDSNDELSFSGSIYTGSSSDPDSVHIANWKKLADVVWKAPFQNGRNFNDPPYSMKDTAVCYYFEPRNLGPGEKRELAFTLAMNHDGDFTIPQTVAVFKPVTIEPLPFVEAPPLIEVKAFPERTETPVIPEIPVLQKPQELAEVSVPEPALQQIEESDKTETVKIAPAPALASEIVKPDRVSDEAAIINARNQDLAMLRSLQEKIESHISAGTGTDGEIRELEIVINMLRAKYGLGSR